MDQSSPSSVTPVTGRDTSAEAFAALSNETRRRLSERLYESMRHAHQHGVRDMSRRELRNYHNQHTGEWLELCSVASTVNALLAAGRFEPGVARKCSESPRQRDVVPVRCKAQQQSIA
ncbi:hypothetical protein [Comamonas terrae]|uniref:Uncharacterized protein n=1 Tax=Comamonas terrae TaxID=673548 RepID=A0ABW5UQI1_9BURK|nr:hypothetical protein [Comamonas terrae]